MAYNKNISAGELKNGHFLENSTRIGKNFFRPLKMCGISDAAILDLGETFNVHIPSRNVVFVSFNFHQSQIGMQMLKR